MYRLVFNRTDDKENEIKSTRTRPRTRRYFTWRPTHFFIVWSNDTNAMHCVCTRVYVWVCVVPYSKPKPIFNDHLTQYIGIIRLEQIWHVIVVHIFNISQCSFVSVHHVAGDSSSRSSIFWLTGISFLLQLNVWVGILSLLARVTLSRINAWNKVQRFVLRAWLLQILCNQSTIQCQCLHVRSSASPASSWIVIDFNHQFVHLLCRRTVTNTDTTERRRQWSIRDFVFNLWLDYECTAYGRVCSVTPHPPYHTCETRSLTSFVIFVFFFCCRREQHYVHGIPILCIFLILFLPLSSFRCSVVNRLYTICVVRTKNWFFFVRFIAFHVCHIAHSSCKCTYDNTRRVVRMRRTR